MDVILLRHTQVALPAGHCYGQLDVPLLDPAVPSFADVAQRLVALCPRVAQLHSSPLQRAQQLAEHLGQQLRLPVQSDARWMELHFGAWEGRHWNTIPRSQSDPWAANYHHVAPPGGETHAALVARVRAALTELGQRSDGPAVVVTHAGPMRCALAAALGLPPEQQPDVQLDLGGLLWLSARRDTVNVRQLRWTLKALNR
jgi:alpha-ribazole phosphatase